MQPDLTADPGWARSSSRLSDTHCVEVARTGDTVMVRHAGYPDGLVMAFRVAEFRAFLEGVVDGDFDHLTERR